MGMDSTVTEGVAVDRVDRSAVSAWDSLLSKAADPRLAEALDPGRTDEDEALRSAFRDELDDPGLVLSHQYIGPDRRSTGLRAWLYRSTFGARRSVLKLE